MLSRPVSVAACRSHGISVAISIAISASLVGLGLAGCVVEPPAATRAEIAIPGPWVAPPSTQAIAASQFVPVVDPPSVSPLGSCSSTNPFACSCAHPACTPAHPGTNELRTYLLGRFPGIRNSGTYCCRQNSNALSQLSVHAIGRAIDLGVPMVGGDADNTVGDQVANFLVENAEYIGIQRVIWDHTFWNGQRGFGALGGNPHIDHLHIELSQAGAARSTLFFTVGAPTMSCTPACAGTRRIDADCSSVDCALTGAECLTAPVRCGAPPPPEPAEAVRVAGSSFPTLSTVGDPARLTFAGPDRLFDTRSSSAGLTWNAGSNELEWASGLPASVQGVWLNVAAIATLPGFVTTFPTGSPRPGTSSLNTSGRVRANLVPTPLGTAQSLTFFELNPVELIGDVYATMGASGAGLELVDPVRVFDSRSIGAPLLAGTITVVDVRAPPGATGVLGSVAALRPAGDSFLSVFPCGADPATSTVNVLGTEIASNQVVSALGADGTLCMRSQLDMDAVFDVLGYFSPDGALEYQALAPTRLVDTRNAVFYENRLAAHQRIELPLATAPGMPENGWAAVFNVATLEADGDGFVAAFACERGAPPGTSAHNFGSDVRATLVTSDLGTSRRACIETSTRTHVIVDLLGVWRRRDGVAPPDPEPMPEPEPDPEPTADDGGVAADDAGPSGRLDAGTRGDGGAPAFDAGTGGLEPGCGCRAAGGDERSPRGVALAIFVAALALRRLRRPDRPRRRSLGQ